MATKRQAVPSRCTFCHLGVLDLLADHEQVLGQVIVLAGLHKKGTLVHEWRRHYVEAEASACRRPGGHQQGNWKKGAVHSQRTSLALAMTSLYLEVSAARR